MVKVIRLFSEYACYPLWHVPKVGVNSPCGDINPEELPLNENTIASLLKWADEYDDVIMDLLIMANNSFEEDIVAFDNEGIRLWKLVQDELGSEYKVIYYSKLHCKSFRHISELDNE